MTSYQVSPDVVWPDVELVVRSWLVANLPASINVRTETDATFGTSTPNASMTLPLVLVQRVPGGSLDANLSTDSAAVDVECFAATRAAMWTLYQQVHAWMLRILTQSTQYGTVDDIEVANGVGELNYNNPDLRRCVTTYRVSTRPNSPL